MKIMRVEKTSAQWIALAEYMENAWEYGGHLAGCMKRGALKDWEAVFAALDDQRFVGFCSLLEEDYYPENRYSPWISSVFVEKSHRGHFLSRQLVAAAEDYARELGFKAAYIPTDGTGFYERMGYEKIDELVNYGGDTDNVYRKLL